MSYIVREENTEKPVVPVRRRILAIALGLLIPVCVIYFAMPDMHAVRLYNPLETNLEVKINGDTYTLKPRELKKVRLSADSYKVKSSVNGKTIIDSTLVIGENEKGGGGIINLSGESMYLWSMQYGDGTSAILDNMMEHSGKNHSAWDSVLNTMHTGGDKYTMVMVDSVLLYGNIKEYPATQFFISKGWYFGPNDPVEEKIKTSGTSFMGRETISKLFSKHDLLEYWKEKSQVPTDESSPE